MSWVETAMWWPKDDLGPITEEEMAEMEKSEREYAEWEATPEGQEFLAERAAVKAARDANPNRLSKHVEPKNMPLIYAQGVQRVYDRTGEPCTLKEGGIEAGMDSDEYVIAAAFAINQGLIVHPTHPVDPNLEAPYLMMPGVG